MQGNLRSISSLYSPVRASLNILQSIKTSFVPALASVAVLLSAAPAQAGPELDRILSSVAGRFLVTETIGGRAVTEAAIGRILRPADGVRDLITRFGEPAMRTAAERLEARMARVESEFRRSYPALVIEELTVAQRATLRLLAHQELEGFEFLDAGMHPAGYSNSRRLFAAAIPADGLAHVIRYPAGVEPFLHPDWMIQFGFESEFTMNELEGLVSVYGPAPEFGVSVTQWEALSAAERVQWVKGNLDSLFPAAREYGGLVRVTRDPKLQFLPERLLRDSTGNLEIVMSPVNSFEEWKQRIFLANETLGVGSMQGTMSVPSDAFFGRADAHSPPTLVREDIGFFNFHNDLDTIEKLEVGAARFARDPSKPAANSFNHSFLGPMTRLKQDMLVQYLEANARGEMLDAESLRRVSGDDNSFKYTGGTSYRPDIVRGRVILEVRDAHNNVEALLERMSRGLVYLERGRGSFAEAASLPAFDSRVDFAKLPADSQTMLRNLFPAKLVAGLEYNEQERLALEVFRNFAYPMRDWDAQLRFVGRMDLRNGVRLAQNGYTAKLSRIAAELQAGHINAQQASLRVQGALTEFATESKLGEAYRARARQLLEQTNHAHREPQRRPA